MNLINAGFRNFVNDKRILAVVDFSKAKSQPVLRAIRNANDMGIVIDVTMGRATNSVIFMDSGHIILSHSAGPTIANRVKENREQKEDKQC